MIALNLIPILMISLLLIVCYFKFPNGTMTVLIVFGNALRILSFVFFAMAAVGLFAPKLAFTDEAYVKDILYMVLRMVLVACGGMVLSHIILSRFKKQIGVVAHKLGVNEVSVVGLILSFTQSLAMLPLFSQMDRKGKILNAAFSVCGAYVVGGQLAFVSSLAEGSQAMAYIVCKLISGLLAVAVAAVFSGNKTAES